MKRQIFLTLITLMVVACFVISVSLIAIVIFIYTK